MKNYSVKHILVATCVTLAMVGCDNYDVTMATLLDEMTSFESVMEYVGDEYRTLQQSSYDRHSVSPDAEGWFAINDGFGFIRTEERDGRTEKVLFEDKGAGAITRIWITTQNPQGIIRFYFDGSDIPGWMVPAYDLMQFGIDELGEGLLQAHTSYERGVKGGSTLWLPIPYAKGCKVTLEEAAHLGEVPHYFHFNYRKYLKDVKVESMSIEVVDKYASKIAKANHLLLHPKECVAKGKITTCESVLMPGDTLRLTLPDGSRVVNSLTIGVSEFSSDEYQDLMRSLIIMGCFDGKATIWAPLADFSGGGMGAPRVDSWYLYSDGKGSVESRWAMPYKDGGEIAIYNAHPTPCRVRVECNTSPKRWSDNTMYFHATWKQERDLPFYNQYLQRNIWDWNFITIEGRATYRGDVLSLFNHSRAWYGEGDEKIWIDDDTFPSHYGTGVEDYYNSSWAPVVPFYTPFGGAPRADLDSSMGYNGWVRTRNLDCIPCNNRLCFNMEMKGWLDGKVDYATTSFWYGDKESRAIKTSGLEEVKVKMPLPPEDPSKYQIPGAIEMESVKFSRKSQALNVSRQGMTEFADGQWSRAAHLLGFGGRVGDSVEFTLRDIEDGSFNLNLYATKAGDYGIIAVEVNGKRLRTLDLYDTSVTSTGAINLGRVSVEGGELELKVVIVGKNSKSFGYVFGLDCVTLSK